MFETVIVAARDRQRLGEVAGIAARYGLDVLFARLGLAGTDGRRDGADLPRRTREAMEVLGPTYVKLGQILATRGDLLPPEWVAELERLHADAPTTPFPALRSAVEAALGEAPETVFAAFDPEPLAAASMAQVHRATLHDGSPVVLKIRRPGIRPRIEADLRLLTQFARTVAAASPEARRFDPEAMVRQLADALLSELDFANEGRNADILARDFVGDARVVVPAIHWQWTSETLLVMDFVAGVAPRDAAALRDAGIDPAAIADLGTDIVLDMMLVNGRFHADPHPGNLLCLPGNRIALIDLGMIGHVSPRRREEFLAFVQALVLRDADGLADVLTRWSSTPVPQERLRAAAERLVARHGGETIVLAAIMRDMMALMRAEGVAMPPDLLLIFKALLTIDGVLQGIAPGFDLSAAMRRAIGRLALARLAPDRWLPTVQALAWELSRIGEDAPRLLRALVRQVEGRGQGAAVDPSPAIRRAARSIATAILIGAAMVAGAMMLR